MSAGAVVGKTLLDTRFHVVGWGIGLFLLTVLIMITFPTLEGDDSFEQYWEEIPDGVKALFGDVQSITQLPGYLESQLFAYLALLLAIFTIAQAGRAIAGEEENNTLDLVLAQPITRRQYLFERMLGLYASTLIILALISLGVVLGALLIGETDDLGALTVTAFDEFPPIFVITSIAFLGTATTTKIRAVLIATAYAVSAYFLNGLAALADWLEPIQRMSVFYYSSQSNPLDGGFDWYAIVIQLMFGTGLSLLALMYVERKELRN